MGDVVANLKDRLAEEIKQALKSGQKVRLAALRLLSSSLHNREVEVRRPLTEAELSTLRLHVDLGAQQLHRCHAVSRLAVSIVAHHHEAMDGSGYPGGVAAEQEKCNQACQKASCNGAKMV